MRGKSSQWERELDGLIEENVKLNDERSDLMKKVTVAKKRASQSGKGVDFGTMARTTEPLRAQSAKFGKRGDSGSRRLIGFTAAQEHELEVYRQRLLEQTKIIAQTKQQIQEMQVEAVSSTQNQVLQENKAKQEVALIESRRYLGSLE